MKLTKYIAEEIGGKMDILADTPELQEDYNITQDQADEIAAIIPRNGGEVEFAEWMKPIVAEELRDRAVTLRAICKVSGEYLTDGKLAARLERLADELSE